MSEKKAAEKVSEIDEHISKQYDIVRRLGKGVIFAHRLLLIPFLLLAACRMEFAGPV